MTDFAEVGSGSTELRPDDWKGNAERQRTRRGPSGRLPPPPPMKLERRNRSLGALPCTLPRNSR
jgi:hypothetical protein